MSDMDWANISDATPSLSWPPQPSHNITNDEIERLRAELAAAIKQRDEARREWCYMESCVRIEYGREPADQPSIAAERGWDCFAKKEGGGA